MLKRLIAQTIVFTVVGAVIGYFLRPVVPSKMAVELTQTMGSIAAIAGSLLGWSAGWLDRSRAVIRDVDYDAARQLFRSIGQSQTKLIARWGIALASSLSAIVCSVVLKTGDLTDPTFYGVFMGAIAFLTISIGTIAYLFESMIAAAHLKAKLEEYEHDELRKLRNKPEQDKTLV